MNWISLLGIDAFVTRWRVNVIEGAIAAEDRMDLARLEWHEQKARLGQIIALTIMVGGVTVVALIMVSLAVLVQFWDSPDRTLIAWAIAAVWAVGWALILVRLIALAKQATQGFALTRRELARDWREIKEKL